MSDRSNETLTIDPHLKGRLTALASRSGCTYAELAENILRRHADEQERLISEYTEDEERWQRYLQSGKSISFEKMRNRLRQLAADAALAER